MNLLNQSAFLKALGWSLLDSLWQIGVLWLVYVFLTANGKRFQSRQRHSLALLSLAGGSLWFLVTLVINLYKAAAAPEVVTVFIRTGAPVPTQASLLNQVYGFFEPALPYLSTAYLIAAAFLFIRFYHHYRYTRRLFTAGLKKAHPEWRVFLQQAVQHMGIKKKVSIWFSSLVDTPLTFGFLKPVILLPIAAVNHLTIQQAEAIILHELNHIRRNDYLVNLLIACADIILFFNPFSRLLTNIIRKERENSCDDMVLQFRYDAHIYANALLILEKNRLEDTCELAVPAVGKEKQLLLNRVKRILTNEPVTTPLNQKFIAYLLSAMLIGFIGWYNPGKIIIKTIAEVRAPQPVGFTETATTFSTPPAEKPVTVSVKATTHKADNTKNKRDKYKTIRQLIEWTTDVKLAALNNTKLEQEVADNWAVFANANEYESKAFSMPQSQVITLPAGAAAEIYPYVPSTSFLYQVTEDTALPKKYIMTYKELQAKETMDKALSALKEVDWNKLQKEVNAKSGKKIDILALKNDLELALRDVDWKKINEESEKNSDTPEELTTAQEMLRTQLSNYQKDRAIRQEKIKAAQQQILMERLQQHEDLKKAEETNKKKSSSPCGAPVRVKKIVQI